MGGGGQLVFPVAGPKVSSVMLSGRVTQKEDGLWNRTEWRHIPAPPNLSQHFAKQLLPGV